MCDSRKDFGRQIGEGKFRDNRKMRGKTAEFVFNLGCVDAVVVGFESLDEIRDYETIVRNTSRKTA